MRTIIRFFVFSTLIAAAIYAAMYVFATRFEPEARPMEHKIRSIKIREPG
jgi:hypothetical protein